VIGLWRVVVLWLVALPALAAEVTVQLDSRDMRVGQTIGLRVVVVDAQKAQPPNFAAVDGLQVVYQGTQQSTVMVNFRTTRTLTFNYALTALAEGQYDLQPAAVSVEGQRLQAPPVGLRVRARDSGAATADTIFGTLGVDDIWVGQVVVHRVEFRTRKRLLDLRWQAPVFEGFVPDPLAQPVQREYPVVEDGLSWTVLELDTPLQASLAGAREVPAGVLRTQFAVTAETARRRGLGLGRFAEARTEAHATEPLDLWVREVPTKGRTQDWSGLVGHFELEATLDRATLKLGESATMTVVLHGSGSLAGLALPGVGDDVGVRVYDDEPEVQAEVRSGEYHAVGTWRRAVVPEQLGPLTLPALTLQVFDPTVGDFATLRTEPLELQVLPGEAAELSIQDPQEAALDRRREVAAVGEDILPIHPRARLRSQVFDPRSPGLLAVVGLPLLGLLGVLAREHLQARRPRHDPRAALRRSLADASGQQLGVAELEGLFREALGLALGQPPAGLERSAAAAGLSGDLRARVLDLYTDLDRARYGGGDRAGLQARVLQAASELLDRRAP